MSLHFTLREHISKVQAIAQSEKSLWQCV